MKQRKTGLLTFTGLLWIAAIISALIFVPWYFSLRDLMQSARPSELYLHDGNWTAKIAVGGRDYLVTIPASDGSEAQSEQSTVSSLLIERMYYESDELYVDQWGDDLIVVQYTNIAARPDDSLTVQAFQWENGKLVPFAQTSFPPGKYRTVQPGYMPPDFYLKAITEADLVRGISRSEDFVRISRSGIEIVSLSEVDTISDQRFAVPFAAIDEWISWQVQRGVLSTNDVDGVLALAEGLKQELDTVGEWMDLRDLSIDERFLSYHTSQFAWQTDIRTGEIHRANAIDWHAAFRNQYGRDAAISMIQAVVPFDLIKPLIIGLVAFQLVWGFVIANLRRKDREKAWPYD